VLFIVFLQSAQICSPSGKHVKNSISPNFQGLAKTHGAEKADFPELFTTYKNDLLVFGLQFSDYSAFRFEPRADSGHNATRWKDAGGVMHEADFDSSGNVVKTARSVKPEELPKPVQEAIEKKYAGAKISEATFFEGKATEYEIKMTDAGGKKLLLVVSPDGVKLTAFDM